MLEGPHVGPSGLVEGHPLPLFTRWPEKPVGGLQASIWLWKDHMLVLLQKEVMAKLGKPWS